MVVVSGCIGRGVVLIQMEEALKVIVGGKWFTDYVSVIILLLMMSHCRKLTHILTCLCIKQRYTVLCVVLNMKDHVLSRQYVLRFVVLSSHCWSVARVKSHGEATKHWKTRRVI